MFGSITGYGTSGNSWKAAFCNATAVEQEGASYFEDFFSKNKLTSEDDSHPPIDDQTVSPSTTEMVNVDGQGGFCQPTSLAQFLPLLRLPWRAQRCYSP